MESEESEYNAYMFYQLLEERTSHSHALVEDIKVTPDLGRIISHLWSDKGIQEAFKRSSQGARAVNPSASPRHRGHHPNAEQAYAHLIQGHAKLPRELGSQARPEML